MSDFFCSIMEDLYGLYKIELPKEFGLSVDFTDPTNGIKVSLQMEDNPHGILMVTELGRLPSGAARMLWTQEALRWNSEAGVTGILCMNKEIDTLIMGHLFPIQNVNAQIIYESLPIFEERARIWKESVDRGYPPTLPGAAEIQIQSAQSPMNMAAGMASSRYRRELRP